MILAHYKLRSAGVSAGWTIAAVLASGYVGVLPAQSSMAPTPGAKTTSAASQDAAMKVMIGVPLPFGIMIGRAEGWMAGYQYMFDRLDGILDGGDAISPTDVLVRFQTAPTSMAMQMHMGMIMYAPTSTFTMMASIPYITTSMDELHRDGTRSTERSAGIGDADVRGLYSLYATPHLHDRILANFGIGLPTGSVNQRDAEGARTEYPMQTGSGTLSLLPGLTYLGQALPWSWGGEFTSTIRIGTNEHGYRLGNRYEPAIWVARKLTRWMSLSAGAAGESWGNIHGSDALLDPTDEPAKDPTMQGGKRLDAILGVTLHPATGFFKELQFLVQGEAPIVQTLDGPQLKRSSMLHLAWQWEF